MPLWFRGFSRKNSLRSWLPYNEEKSAGHQLICTYIIIDTVLGSLPYQLVGQIFWTINISTFLDVLPPCNQGCSEVKRPNSSDTGTGLASPLLPILPRSFAQQVLFFSHQEARCVPCRSRTRSAFLNLCRSPTEMMISAVWGKGLGGFEPNPPKKHAVQPGKVNWLTWKLKTADFQKASFWNQLPWGCMLVFSGGLHIGCNNRFSYLSFLMKIYTSIS